jgi:hypothetical protein
METNLPKELPDSEDLLGFCERCFRMRWLRWLTSYDKSGNPTGICRTCAREGQTPESAS